MTVEEKWHRHLGVYGVCYDETSGKLLVVEKVTGPYSDRYDIPGGSIKPSESLTQALQREFWEEAEMDVDIVSSLGAYDFLVQYPFKETTHTHHIGIFNRVQVRQMDRPSDEIQEMLPTHDGWEKNDSKGARWVNPLLLREEECSPLLLKVVDWIRTGRFSHEMVQYEEWRVRKHEQTTQG